MEDSASPSSFSLASLGPVFIFATHLTDTELHKAEEDLVDHDGQLTYNAAEARLFLGRMTQKKRAAFDLRAKGVWTEEISRQEPATKRRRINRSTNRSRDEDIQSDTTLSDAESPINSRHEKDHGFIPLSPDNIAVLRLEWLQLSIKKQRLIPLDTYIVYYAKILEQPPGEVPPKPLQDAITYVKARPDATSHAVTTQKPKAEDENTFLSHTETVGGQTLRKGHPTAHQPRRRFNQTSSPAFTHPNKPPKLIRTTTSLFEADEARSLPEPPEWVKKHNIYACCRSTPLKCANEPFLLQLRAIKEARILTLDEIGVRAYATSIAAIAAYPHLIQSPSEILRLPGCEQKIATLWIEWCNSAEDESERFLPTVRALDEDEDLRHLRLFYDIWGVGADTARRLYFDKGWKDLDDIVEFGWNTLNRVQQIGVKFYEEFRVTVSREESEQISDRILRHARSCRGIPEQDWGTDNDMVVVIVGGYRRGKEQSGDVDVILSHRNEEYTYEVVLDVVSSLEQEGWITHTLTLNTTTSNRDQQTLAYRGEGHGHGFDSLDKALCVWQDPHYDRTKEQKNPNIHRRVDIIVSPWRTVGCAILGWSGGTTFQRDMRRWVKREKGWKFDSSGVRDRATGQVLDLESPQKDDDGDTWLDREKRLMNGMGFGWRDPGERCTW